MCLSVCLSVCFCAPVHLYSLLSPPPAPHTHIHPQEDLAERASWLLAEEEVLLSEQQAAGGGGAGGGQGGADATPGQQALADHPSSILDGLTATDVNKMKVCVCVNNLVAFVSFFWGGDRGRWEGCGAGWGPCWEWGY